MRPMDEPTAARTCASCHEHPAGQGGILCSGCLARITAANATYWEDHEVTVVRGVARVVPKQISASADGSQPAHIPVG